MWPVILHLGPLTIYSYGTMMAIAFLVAGWLTGKEMDRRGLPAEVASSMVFWAAVGGIGGSKLWAVLQDCRRCSHDPIGHDLLRARDSSGTAGWSAARAAVSWIITVSTCPG